MPSLCFSAIWLIRPKNARLDEFDQSFEHLRLAGEMAVQGRFRHGQSGRQCGSGDLFAFRLLQHCGEGLKNL